jgi:hypothetical protein
MRAVYTLSFVQGYVGHPYWPELERVINIDKESGTRRARSEATKSNALTQHLLRIGMTVEELAELRIKAERPFYTVADMPAPLRNGHDTNEIIIPQIHILGCLTQAADTAPSATRVANPEQIRSVLQVPEPIFTGKHEADGVWERFTVVTSGTGAKLSNQRALRRNSYISGFSAPLTIEFDDSLVDPAKVRNFLSYAGREVGIGASRKLGWGRFTVS